VIISPETPLRYQDIEQFLTDSGIQIEHIPVTIVVNPPIRTVIENVGVLSKILMELLEAYRTDGDYFLELVKSPPGIVVVFGIVHTATSLTTEIGHC